jgi:hypothetical protein
MSDPKFINKIKYPPNTGQNQRNAVRTSGESFGFHCGVHHIRHFEKKGGIWVGFCPLQIWGEGARDQKKIARFSHCIAIGSQKKGGGARFFHFHNSFMANFGLTLCYVDSPP